MGTRQAFLLSRSEALAEVTLPIRSIDGESRLHMNCNKIKSRTLILDLSRDRGVRQLASFQLESLILAQNER